MVKMRNKSILIHSIEFSKQLRLRISGWRWMDGWMLVFWINSIKRSGVVSKRRSKLESVKWNQMDPYRIFSPPQKVCRTVRRLIALCVEIHGKTSIFASIFGARHCATQHAHNENQSRAHMSTQRAHTRWHNEWSVSNDMRLGICGHATKKKYYSLLFISILFVK